MEKVGKVVDGGGAPKFADWCAKPVPAPSHLPKSECPAIHVWTAWWIHSFPKTITIITTSNTRQHPNLHKMLGKHIFLPSFLPFLIPSFSLYAVGWIFPWWNSEPNSSAHLLLLLKGEETCMVYRDRQKNRTECPHAEASNIHISMVQNYTYASTYHQKETHTYTHTHIHAYRHILYIICIYIHIHIHIHAYRQTHTFTQYAYTYTYTYTYTYAHTRTHYYTCAWLNQLNYTKQGLEKSLGVFHTWLE